MEPEDNFRKRARVSGAVGGCLAGGPDRLSSLPECLLHTIMSFLKARQVVQTCVLSTRWRHLWRSMPCLDIDFDEFSNKAPPSNSDSSSSSSDSDTSDSDSDTADSDSDTPSVPWSLSFENRAPLTFTLPWRQTPWDGGSTSDSDSDIDSDSKRALAFNNRLDKYKDWEPFEDFALTLMSRCNIAQLDSFWLHIVRSRAPEFGDRMAAGWLRRVMKYCTPDHASKLGLSSGSWRLKRLHLCHVHLDDHFMKRVSLLCRSLQDLELDGCSCEIQSITSQSLKTLVLKRCGCRNLSEIISPTLKELVIDGSSNTCVCVLVILAPALAYLHLAVDVNAFCGGVSLNEVPSVDKASIHLRGHRYINDGTKLGGDQFKLLCSISNSTNLELSSIGTEVLGKEPRFQEFKNLRNLLLDNCDLSDDLRTLVFFLQGSPILEKLTLRCCKFPKYSKKEGTPILKKTSSSELRGLDLLCENLKVEIIYKYDYGDFIRLLQLVCVNLSKNIKLTKVD